MMPNELISAVEDFVQADLKNVDCSHDWNHIKRVRKNALKILEMENLNGNYMNSDILVIELAALMHDVGDFKYSKDHSAGPRLVNEFLRNHIGPNLTESQVEKIVQIVANISFRHEVSQGISSSVSEEFYIVQDADRLDAIGTIGIARCFAYSGAKNRPLYIESDRHLKFDDSNLNCYKYEGGSGSALSHFYEKLFKIKDMMKTETGRSMALIKTDNMKIFIETMRDECDLN